MSIYGTGIIKGMIVTMRNLLRPHLTVEYPDERLVLHDRTRWALHPLFDDEGNPKCTGCNACVKECPDYILHLETSKKEEGGRHIDTFYYEMGACMMCGLCVEACPYAAIEMSHEYELATYNHDELVRLLLAGVDAASTRKDRPEKKAATSDTAAAAPAAEGGASGAAAPAAEKEAKEGTDA